MADILVTRWFANETKRTKRTRHATSFQHSYHELGLSTHKMVYTGLCGMTIDEACHSTIGA